MSAYARNYVYFVTDPEIAKKMAQPSISREKMDEMRREVEKYLPKKDDKKD